MTLIEQIQAVVKPLVDENSRLKAENKQLKEIIGGIDGNIRKSKENQVVEKIHKD